MRKELPSRPNIEHLKTQAKDLLDEVRRKEPEAIERVRESLPAAHISDQIFPTFALHDAQSVIAREHGFARFDELRRHVEALALRALMAAHPSAPLPDPVIEAMRVAGTQKPKIQPISGSKSLPAIPLRGALLTAGAIAPIQIGRPSSIAAVKAARDAIAIFSQKDAAQESPTQNDLHTVGCVAEILATMDGFIVVRGIQWVMLEAIELMGKDVEPSLRARVRPFVIQYVGDEATVVELDRKLRAKVKALAAALPGGDRIRSMIDDMDPSALADATIANIPCSIEDKARYASEPTIERRLERVLALIGENGQK